MGARTNRKLLPQERRPLWPMGPSDGPRAALVGGGWRLCEHSGLGMIAQLVQMLARPGRRPIAHLGIRFDGLADATTRAASRHGYTRAGVPHVFEIHMDRGPHFRPADGPPWSTAKDLHAFEIVRPPNGYRALSPDVRVAYVRSLFASCVGLCESGYGFDWTSYVEAACVPCCALRCASARVCDSGNCVSLILLALARAQGSVVCDDSPDSDERLARALGLEHPSACRARSLAYTPQDAIRALQAAGVLSSHNSTDLQS